MDKKDDPRDRILGTATELFARKGYGLVGVREIARQADVNISMISYYFNGKMGILSAIINHFFDDYIAVLKTSFDPQEPPETSVKKLVRNVIEFLRNYTDEALVMFGQLSIDAPEIQDLKVERLRESFHFLQGLMRKFGLEPNEQQQQVAIFLPAVLSILMSSFWLRPLVKGLFDVDYTDEFYQSYSNQLTAFILGGISSVRQS